MKYPAIYQSTVNGNAILLFSDKQGVVLDKHETVIGTSCGWIESAFKNITAEYLANTYGEVKSKEHAEFIKLLAETNKIPCAVLSIDMNYTMFYVIDGCLFFCVKDIDAVGDYRKITIPLPPESNANTPEEDFEMQQIEKNNGDNLIFGDADKCKEWPCVGDEVCWSNGCYKGIVKARHWNDLWVMESDGEFSTLYIDDVSKPKTPEQELRDELSDLAFNQFNDDSYDLTHNSYYLAEQILSKYNITKKPQ